MHQSPHESEYTFVNFGTFPVPPSANQLYTQISNRRIKTKAYKRWLFTPPFPPRIDSNTLGLSLIRDAIDMNDKSSRYCVKISAAVGRNRDIDNIIKPTIDLFVKNMIILDDRYVEEIHVRRIEINPLNLRNTMQVSVGIKKCLK